MARAKTLHLYLWSCDATENRQFSMESVLNDMKLRDYAQLLGITVSDLPNIDDFLARDVKVSALPDPHCNTLINGQPTFYSFKSMLTVLIKLGLVSPAANPDHGGEAPSETGNGTPADHAVEGGGDNCASFTHFLLVPTVRLPGKADQASVGGGSPTELPSSHLALGTVAQFGITSDTTRDRAYTFDRSGELGEYWSDLHSFVTERSRANASQSRDTEPPAPAKASPEDMARQEGLPNLPELFRLRSWSVDKPLTAPQRADVEKTIRQADMQAPFDFRAILQIARSTKIALVSLVAHFNDTHMPAVVASRLMPIRHRSGASSQATNATTAVSGGPRKSRKRQSAARSRQSESAGAVGGVAVAHEPDHVAAYMASAQAERRQDATSSTGQAQAVRSVDEAKMLDPDDADRIVPRRAAKLQWNSQMDMDLAVAYMAERNRVARSDKCYRVSWANIGVELSVSAARARRRWAVLQKDPKFKQAMTMASNGSASQSSLLQLILQGGNEPSGLIDTHLPDSVGALQSRFHIRDGSAPVQWAGRINPKLSALMLALKAILLVPEDQCERGTAISLLTRFQNTDIENAIKIMKAQHLLTSVKGAKLNSRAFRLSTKFHESRKLITENYQRDIFDSIRTASADIRAKLDPSDAAAGAPLEDVDPVTGGGYAAVVLGQMVDGTLALSAKPSSHGGEETTMDAEHDTNNSTAPHASILSHLLLVGAVQQSAEGGAGNGVEGANMSVQLPPWKISMWRSGALRSTDEARRPQQTDLTIDWSGFELVEACAQMQSAAPCVDLPESILQAATKILLPQEIVCGIFSEIHMSGREGTTIGDIMQLIKPVDSASRAGVGTRDTVSTASVSAAAERVVKFLASQRCIVRVSAWDHHRYVSGSLDHFWSVPQLPKPSVGQMSPSRCEGQEARDQNENAHAGTGAVCRKKKRQMRKRDY